MGEPQGTLHQEEYMIDSTVMVDYVVKGDIAILEVNNPPVNALGTTVRESIIKHLKSANSNPTVKAIVLCGKGKTFPAGGDLKENASRRKQGRAELKDSHVRIDDALELSSKPVVAAIHGTALGGGLELALSSHYRIAMPSARVGLTEVQVGVIPGLGGTQRLPRIVGLAKAINLISMGKHVKAKDAFKIGLIDKIVDSGASIKEEGIMFARTVMNKPFDHRVTNQRSVPDAADYERIIDDAVRMVKHKFKGQQAPLKSVQATAASVTAKSFKEGIDCERQLFAELFKSDQAVCLEYAFFAQRAAQKWEIPGGESHKTVKPGSFKIGAVIGGGTMGSGIAMSMLNAGIPTFMVEQNQKFLDQGVKNVQDLYTGSVELGLLTAKQASFLMSKLIPTTKYSHLANVDIVIEAVYENMVLKKKIFVELDKACKPSALLCSSTSSLDIDQIAGATSRPDKVIGAHFFAPAYYMKLLEVVRGAKTSPETIATTFAYGMKIGKVPVLVGNYHGGVLATRMGEIYKEEARFIVEEGLLPNQVDKIIEDFGMVMGPMRVSDLSGMDIGVSIKKELCKSRGIPYDPHALTINGVRTSPLIDILVEQGRLGRKTGKGWYKYASVGAKTPEVDPEVTALIEKFCKEAGVHRRQIPVKEVYERCLYSLMNEGFKVLEEGMVSKPQDIDIIWCLGYGWPRHKGGPMHLASRIGLKEIYSRVCMYHRLFPNTAHWKPSTLLHHLATTSPDAPMSAWKMEKSKL